MAETEETTEAESRRPACRDIPWLVTLAVFFGISRYWAHARGIRFDDGILAYGYQFLDPELLRHDLVRSLWYFHAQPPLYNLFLGMVLKLFPGNETAAFCWIYRALGATLTWGCYALGRELSLPRPAAFAVALLVMISPAAILYENWLFYTYPVALLMILAALFFVRTLRSGSLFDGGAFFALLMLLVLIRSIFHPVWFLALTGLVILARQGEWKRSLMLAALPFAIVLSLFLKNAFLFGEFTSSTWMGMSFSKMMTTELTGEEWEQLRADPEYPGILDVPAFENVRDYRPHLNNTYEPWGIPALDDTEKSTGFEDAEGTTHAYFNTNHGQYVDASNEFATASRFVLARKPGAYFRSVNRALAIYFKPASEYLFLAPNARVIHGYETFYNAFLHGKFGEHAFVKEQGRLDYSDRKSDWGHIGFVTLLALLAVIAFGMERTIQIVRRVESRTPANWAFLFLAGNIAYVTLIGVLLEVGENNRFRYQIEPLLFVAVAAAINMLWREHGRRSKTG